MLYSYLTSEDLDAAIKEEQLTQLVRDNLGLIAVAEANAVSWMKDYLGQRFDMAATFPTIGEWQAGNDYAPARPITLPGRLITGDNLFYERDTATEPSIYTPPYDYNAAGRLTNYAWNNGQCYQALRASVGVEPGVAPNWQLSWLARDPRDAKLITFCLNVTLFRLFTRIAPRRIPELRTSLYNETKEWLTLVRDGMLTPDLPRPIQVEDSSDAIRWGSNPQQSHYY
jgi:hypothetical protein